MLILRTLLIALSFVLSVLASNVLAQDINLLPKFGGQAKNGAQKAADEKFLASIDDYYKGEGRTRLSPGMCAGFKAFTGNGHRLVNETSETVVYLEVGDRSLGDEGIYPDDDLKAVLLDCQWTFQHKDGRLY